MNALTAHEQWEFMHLIDASDSKQIDMLSKAIEDRKNKLLKMIAYIQLQTKQNTFCYNMQMIFELSLLYQKTSLNINGLILQYAQSKNESLVLEIESNCSKLSQYRRGMNIYEDRLNKQSRLVV